jgi:hypothetical protein
VDIEEAALGLVRVAETAWLKQVSAWVLYGRLPSFGREDFFIKEVDSDVQVSLFICLIYYDDANLLRNMGAKGRFYLRL